MKKIHKKKAFLAVLLSAAVLCQTVPVCQAAAEQRGDGLCPHHTEHTDQCGFLEEAAACQFICEECQNIAAESERLEAEAEKAAAESQQKIDHVQSLISALPEVESITADNLESVKGDLAAIEAAKAELDETQQAALNLEKYNAAVERVAVVEGELEAERIESEQAAAESQQKIDNVQSLISALPEADSITEENLESVKGDLAAIEAAKAELDETQQAALNMEKYNAAVERIAAIEAKPQKAPTDTQEAGNDVATVTIDGVETGYPTLAAAIEAADGKTATITVWQSTTEARHIYGGNITLELKNNCSVNKNIAVYGGVIKVIGEGEITQLNNGDRPNGSSGEIIIEGEVMIYTLMPFNGKTTVAKGTIGSLSHWGGTTTITGGDIRNLKGSGNIIVKGGTIIRIDEGTTLSYEPDSVTLDQTELSLQVKEQKTLSVTVTPNISAPGFPVWESSDTGVATVSNGTVTAVAPGDATITVTAGEKTATCSVTVTEDYVATVTIDGVETYCSTLEETFEIANGNTATIKLLKSIIDEKGEIIGHGTISSGNITLDMNGHRLKTPLCSMEVSGGTLIITGSGELDKVGGSSGGEWNRYS